MIRRRLVRYNEKTTSALRGFMEVPNCPMRKLGNKSGVDIS